MATRTRPRRGWPAAHTPKGSSASNGDRWRRSRGRRSTSSSPPRCWAAWAQPRRARQAFERSAEQAGYFEQGRDRLVVPATGRQPESPPDPGGGDGGGGGTGDGGDGSRKVVTLKSGGQIVMSVSVDPFALSRTDREFVFKLIDQLTDYESGKEPKMLESPKGGEPTPDGAAINGQQ